MMAFIKNQFLTFLFGLLSLNLEAMEQIKPTLNRMIPYNRTRFFQQPPTLATLIIAGMFRGKALTSKMKDIWDNTLCEFYDNPGGFSILHEGAALVLNQEATSGFKKNGLFNVMKERYYLLLKKHLEKFNDNEELKKYRCAQILMQNNSVEKVLRRAEYFYFVDDSFDPFKISVNGIVYTHLSKEFNSQQREIVEVWRRSLSQEEKEYLMKALVEKLNREYLLISANCSRLVFENNGYLAPSTATSLSYPSKESLKISIDILKALHTHYPGVINRLNLYSIVQWCFSACKDEESLTLAKQVMEKIFEICPSIDGLESSSGSTALHGLISAKLGKDASLEDIKNKDNELMLTKAKIELLKVLLEKMKRIYTSDQLIAFLNKENRDKLSALDLALTIYNKNTRKPKKATILLDGQEIVTQLLEAGAYDYEAISIFKTLPLDQESCYWAQKAFNKLKMNFIKAGREEELKSFLAGLNRNTMSSMFRCCILENVSF